MEIKNLGFALILLLSCSCLKAQVNDEPIRLANSIHDLLQNGKTQEAQQNTEKLFNLSPPLFTDIIHKVLAQNLYGSNLSASLCMRQLYLKNNSKINRIIKPAYLWSEAMTAKGADTLDRILKEFQSILAGQPSFDSRAERYGLLLLKTLADKTTGTVAARKELLSKIIQNLQAFPYLGKPAPDYKINTERGWRRFLLAYSYEQLYLATKDVAHLEKAASYSPDLIDQGGVDSYFYDAHLLDVADKPDYRVKYWSHLVDIGKKEDALKVITDFTFNYPNAANITQLRQYYQSLKGESGFKEYWYSFINSRAEALPELNLKFDKLAVDFNKNTGKWNYVDVWGTWCGPCLRDLPNLQTYFQANLNKKDTNLEIYTFSFGSQNLGKFMTNNSYSFPVTEIDNAVVKKLKIAYYPTRILITPERKYLKIPFNANWVEYLNNYTLN